MRDIVENRSRISFARKLRLARLVLRENGARWSFLLLIYYAASSLAHRAFTSMDRLRRGQGLPGLNSSTLNREIWNAWDWNAAGDEWTVSDDWKESLIRCVLEPEVPMGSVVLEIGPGAGRWTGPLLARCGAYTGIDISAACIERCQHRFAGEPRARFVIGSGRDLAPIADESIDVIWSFDVFVHVNRTEVASYLQEFARVLRPGGVGIVHHGTVGGASGGWRSDLTASAWRGILSQQKFSPIRSLGRWSDDDTVHTLQYDDMITVFAKPATPPVVS